MSVLDRFAAELQAIRALEAERLDRLEAELEAIRARQVRSSESARAFRRRVGSVLLDLITAAEKERTALDTKREGLYEAYRALLQLHEDRAADPRSQPCAGAPRR
jgi:hypothetical protein